MNLFNDADERRRFLRFALVGISGSVVDFGIFNLLATYLKVPSTAAQAVSFTLAVINNFIWNRLWTYPETRINPVGKQLGQFAFVNVLGIVIRTILFASIENPIINLAAKYVPHFLTPTVIGHNLSLATVILIVMLWNYFANRYWTYRDLTELKEKAKSG